VFGRHLLEFGQGVLLVARVSKGGSSKQQNTKQQKPKKGRCKLDLCPATTRHQQFFKQTADTTAPTETTRHKHPNGNEETPAQRWRPATTSRPSWAIPTRLPQTRASRSKRRRRRARGLQVRDRSREAMVWFPEMPGASWRVSRRSGGASLVAEVVMMARRDDDHHHWQ
jgi:hypothetical protein